MMLGDDGNVDIRFVRECLKVLVRIETNPIPALPMIFILRGSTSISLESFRLQALYSSQLSLKTKGTRSSRCVDAAASMPSLMIAALKSARVPVAVSLGIAMAPAG
jgi:hypothetical protein